MRALKWAAGVVAVLLVVAIGGGIYVKENPIVLVKFISQLRDPIGPNQPVVWQKGPDAPVAGKRPPNIVLILADDLGYNDLTFNGGGVADGAVPTPNINSIAEQGVDLREGYAGNATCAPSRAAIMTGRYATRFGYEFTPAHPLFMKMVGEDAHGIRKPVYFPDKAENYPDVASLGMPASEVTVGEVLQKQGYHTMMFGKWHLGEQPDMKPGAQGFDESLGFLMGAQKYAPDGAPGYQEAKQPWDPIDKFLWAALPYAVSKDGGPRFAPDKYMTDYLGDQAVEAIKANKNRPFFIYLAFNAPHTPLQAKQEDYDALPMIKDHELRVYAAMIRALDRNVGNVLATLKAEGLDDNTLVIFTSDNGGAHYIGLPDINKPYRGWKATFFEGGIHVPYFMRWPGVLQVGTKFSSPVAHVDIFATAAGAAGAAVPTDRKLDGVNLLPFLEGKEAGRPHQTLFWRSAGYRTLLEGDMKLQVDDRRKKTWLYDLKADPTEQNNLAEAEPDKVKELNAVLDGINAEQAPPAWPALAESPIAIDHPANPDRFPDKPDDEYIYWAN
ncbi:MAG: sulfatase-like hydrolase/transferase [Parvibaculum sp.]|uniref:sulfatase-like hydrolase/transferase n=1 Tax=Parvibaculum sp. TaxID=2024848 RepID=UPI0025EF1918|nr:sulfatase-like hydrolase/transferase [Parvibaculum sp.]MCE9649479.1 sulfatase-like hydrolase/transferase [Parvibaculum sp.]